MKDVLFAVGIKIGACVLDCLGRKAWRRRQEAKREADALAELQRQKQVDLEQRVADACKATTDCHNYRPVIVGRTPKSVMTPAERAREHAAETAGHPRTIRKFKPKKGKTKHGKDKRQVGDKTP